MSNILPFICFLGFLLAIYGLYLWHDLKKFNDCEEEL
jgi:hypothetical protein